MQSQAFATSVKLGLGGRRSTSHPSWWRAKTPCHLVRTSRPGIARPFALGHEHGRDGGGMKSAWVSCCLCPRGGQIGQRLLRYRHQGRHAKEATTGVSGQRRLCEQQSSRSPIDLTGRRAAGPDPSHAHACDPGRAGSTPRSVSPSRDARRNALRVGPLERNETLVAAPSQPLRTARYAH